MGLPLSFTRSAPDCGPFCCRDCRGHLSVSRFPPCHKGGDKTPRKLCWGPLGLVFYESPHRIDALLADVLAVLGDRQAFWARELSKIYEDLQAGSISQLLALATGKKNRGEFVLIIQPGPGRQEATGENVEEILLWYKENTELSLKDVSRQVAKDLGPSRSDIYQKALEVWAVTIKI